MMCSGPCFRRWTLRLCASSRRRAWRAHARRDLFRRLCRREQGASITDLDVEVLNDAGRPWEVVVAGRQQPPLARLRGFGFVVNLEAVRQADLGAYDADAFWREGEGNPPRELRLAAVACAASGNVRGVPVQWLREADAIGQCNLIRCGIGNISAALLGLMLPAASVHSLSINYNSIGPQGGVDFAEGLKGNSTMRSLNLGGNSIEAKGATALAAILKETKITDLYLWNNNIGDQGAIALAAILKETNITNLDLGGNDIGDEGATALAAVLKETKITELDLSGNHIGAKGASVLAAILKETKIAKLNLHGNGLDDKAKKAVKKAARGSGVRIAF